jgi:hypothetical protein
MYEPDEPTLDDVEALAGPATPHFALQIRARLRELVRALPETHEVRRHAEQKMALMEQLALASSKAEQGPRASQARPGWGEIPSSAPAEAPLPRS